MDGLNRHVDGSVTTVSPTRSGSKLIIRLPKQTEEVQSRHILIETPLENYNQSIIQILPKTNHHRTEHNKIKGQQIKETPERNDKQW